MEIREPFKPTAEEPCVAGSIPALGTVLIISEFMNAPALANSSPGA
jgi:hypothetical protein